MLRLLITIPLLVVMLPGCGNTPADLGGLGPSDTGNPGGGTGDNTLSNTIVDSDGDGFPDDLEINSTPGTDPFDQTDNPNNVRDTDGDGCSDYDELNFADFCDNDPNTPVSGTCDVAYYNSDFSYGFDLPLGADLDITDIPTTTLFVAGWTFDLGSNIVQISTFVQDMLGSSQSLSDLVEEINSLHRALGDVFLTDVPITLSNGDSGHLSIYTQAIGVVAYQVITIKHGRNYNVVALETIDNLTQSTDAVLTDIVLSLCIE